MSNDQTVPPEPAGVYGSEDSVDRYLAHRHGGTSPNKVMEGPAFWRAVGDVRGQRIVDLGCGDGSGATELLDGGAVSYLGVDSSRVMIERARRNCEHPVATFTQCAIEELDPARASADLVVSRMALHYVGEFQRVVDAVGRALSPGGRFVFSVAHPVLTSHETVADGPRSDWVVDDYFVAGPRDRSWMGGIVTWHHRTVEDYATGLLDAGFRIDGLSECAPDSGLLAQEPDELRRRRRVPLVLLMAATRQGA